MLVLLCLTHLWLSRPIQGQQTRPLITRGVILALLGGAIAFSPMMSRWGHHVLSVRNQHGQMHRFATTVVQGPVAVNDLGVVAWNNPYGVVDLVGLGSDEVRHWRVSRVRPTAGVLREAWTLGLLNPSTKDFIRDASLPPKLSPSAMRDLIERRGVKVIMIYEHWFPEVPSSWRRLGTLVTSPPDSAASRRVAFWAVNGSVAAELTPGLQRWITDLPEGVSFEAEAD
ncbi:MAG: hypothetical protein EA397_14865 [Deltaproteobacteria bacterium]|nr:MAG: hypothetical protein EA397_14865 [Deltaproteobacteria bacterium]